MMCNRVFSTSKREHAAVLSRFLLMEMSEEEVFPFLSTTLWEADSVFGVTVSERPWNSPGPRCCFRKPQSPMKIEKAFLPQQPVFFVVFCFFYFTWRPLQNWEIYAFQAMLEGMAICSQAHLGTSGSDCTQWDPVTGWRGECFSQAVAMFGTLGLCCCPTML